MANLDDKLFGKNKTIASLIAFVVIAIMLVFALFVKYASTRKAVGSDALVELFFVMDGSTLTWYLLLGSLILMIVMAAVYTKRYIAEKKVAK